MEKRIERMIIVRCKRVVREKSSPKRRAHPLTCIRGGTRTATDFPYHSVLCCHPLVGPHYPSAKPHLPTLRLPLALRFEPSLLVPSNGRTSVPPTLPLTDPCQLSAPLSLYFCFLRLYLALPHFVRSLFRSFFL